MKFKSFIIVLLAVMLVFAFASCNNNPKKDEPQPGTKDAIAILTVNEHDITESVWGNEKVQLSWDLSEILPEGIKTGSILTLQFRSNRMPYEYDVRNNKKPSGSGDVRWMYQETEDSLDSLKKDADGWYTMKFTIPDEAYTGKDQPDYENYKYTYLGVNFKCFLMKDDVFEVKNVKIDGKDLPVTAANISKNLSYEAGEDHAWTMPETYVVIYTEGEWRSDDGVTAEVVAKNGKASGVPAEDGFIITYQDEDDEEYDLNTQVTEDTVLYVTKTSTAEPDPEATIAKVTVTQGYEDDYDNYDRFQLTFADQVLAKDSVVTFKYRSTRKISSYSLRAVDGGQKVFYYNTANVVTSTAEDGWTTVTFTMPEKTYSKGVDAEGNKIKSSDSYALVDVDYAKFATEGQGFYICLHGSVTKDDYVEIKDFKIGENDIDLSKKAAVKSGSVTMVAESDDAIPQTCAVFFYEDPSSKKASSYLIHEYGKTFAKPTDPTMEGYDFTGWNKEDDGSGAYWNFEDKNYSDRQLYAIFAEIGAEPDPE